MHTQYFPNRRPGRIQPLGIQQNTIYVYVKVKHVLEFYAIDIRLPYHWHQIAKLNISEMSYTFSTLSPDFRYIYVLFLRVAREMATFAVQRFDLENNGTADLFLLNAAEELYRVFEVPLDSVTLRCDSGGQLVLYDRSIVQGEIPFWTIRLEESTKTFRILKNSIPTAGDDTERNSALFTIAVDPVNRCFAKLMSPRTMLVYTEERKRWVEYHIPVEQSLQDIFGSDGFPVEEIRGIRETFGTHGHRMGALQTRLTFHDLNDVLVARCLHLHWNTTATVEFDHVNREIQVRLLAKFPLDDEVTRMFYLIASKEHHVFLGVYDTAIVHIKSPKLEEIVGWRMQKMLMRDGHKDEVLQISNYRQLLALALTKYADKDEDLAENLKNLGIEPPRKKLVVMEIELD